MTATLEPQVGHRSFSQLHTWLHCGKQYELERVIGVDQVPGIWLIGGSAVHRATEHYDNGSDTPPATLWEDAWSEALAEQQERNPELPFSEWKTAGRPTKDKPNGEDLEWWHKAGLKMVQDYITWRTGPANGWQLFDPGVEVEVSAIFGGVLCKAYLDRLFVMPTGELVVLDLKTGSRVPDPVQTGFYGACTARTIGVRPSYGTYYMARKGTIEVPFSIDQYSPEYWDTVIPLFNKAVDHEIFIPNPSNMCKSCSVNRSCFTYLGGLADGQDPLQQGSTK